MCSLLCPNIIQSTMNFSTMCFFVTIAFHTSPSMRHYKVVDKSLVKYVTMNGMCKLMHIHSRNGRVLDTSFDFRDLVKERLT